MEHVGIVYDPVAARIGDRGIAERGVRAPLLGPRLGMRCRTPGDHREPVLVCDSWSDRVIERVPATGLVVVPATRRGVAHALVLLAHHPVTRWNPLTLHGYRVQRT